MIAAAFGSDCGLARRKKNFMKGRLRWKLEGYFGSSSDPRVCSRRLPVFAPQSWGAVRFARAAVLRLWGAGDAVFPSCFWFSPV